MCVRVCVFAVALCHPCCVLFDETSAERFSGHLVAVFLRETKERQLPKLALCQVGGEDMSGGITIPSLRLAYTHTHTPLGMNRHATSLSDGKLLLNRLGLCNVTFKRMCHHFDGCFEQEDASTACAWSTVYIMLPLKNMGAFCFLGALVPLSLIIICLITVEQSGHLIKVVLIFFFPFCTCPLRLSESIWSAFNQSGAEVTSCYLTSYLYSWLYRQYWPRLSNKTSMHTPRLLHCLIFAGPLSSKPDIPLINGLSLK